MAQSVGAVAIDIVVGKETVSSAVQKVANEAQRSFGSTSGKIASMNKVLDKTQSELTDVDRLLQLDPKNTILLEQKQRLLGSSISETKSKLTELKSSAESANAALAKGDISQKQYDKLQREIIETEQDLKALENQTKSNSNAFSKVKSAMGGIGKACLGVGKVTAVGLGAASTAVVALGKSATGAYANYEQLVGGVETLFGESAKTVIENSSNAYKTAGMSANQYMETVTGFSASLLQSLGGDTVKASEMADMAITDMSDNANKMGTSMESIQNAYQGFAKQNYTMLDNLKLGYGGTKSEMERLLADAEKLPEAMGRKFDISNYSDVVEAIHLVQKEMGISGISMEEYNELVSSGAMTQAEAFELLGTTAKEASTTIQGSLSAVSSSWNNIMSGLADPSQNLDQLINNFVTSVDTAKDNILPRVGEIFNGIVTLIQQLVPQLASEIPNIVTQLLPMVIDGATNLINAIVDVAPQIMQGITQLFGLIVQKLPTLINLIVSQLPTLIPMVIDGIVQMVVTLASSFGEIIQPLIDNLPEIITSITGALLDNLPALIEGCINLVVALVEAMPEIIMALIEAIPTIILQIVEALFTCMPTLLEGVGTVFGGAWDAIKNIFSGVIDFFSGLFSGAVDAIKNVFSVVGDFFSGIWDGVKNVFSGVIDFFSGIFSGAWDAIKNVFSVVSDFFGGIWDSIKNIFAGVGDFFSNIFKKAFNAIKNIFQPIVNFFSNIWNKITGIFKKVGDVIGKAIKNTVSKAVNTVLKTAVGIINGFIKAINLAISVINAIPGVSIKKLKKLEVPEMERGGVLKKGQIGLLEGNGAEAVVPLEKNTGWLTRIADMLNDKMTGRGSFVTPPVLQNVKTGGYVGSSSRSSRIDELIELVRILIDRISDNDTTAQIYIGNELIDEYILNKNSRAVLRSGGRA